MTDPVTTPADTTTTPAAAPADTTTPPADTPAAKWWQAETITAEERQWLEARGLALDDLGEVAPKLIRGHRAAESRIGRGLDSILDAPAKDQKFADWARANAARLGLPEAPDGYAVEPFEDWPKEIPWNADLEGKARALAHEQGVPPEAHKAYVRLFADEVKRLEQAAEAGLTQARDQMMTELTRDYGDQVNAVVSRARIGMQIAAEKAGLSADAIEAIGATLKDKAGDAGVIRLFNAIGELAGEDVMVGRGGPTLDTTPADARAKLAQMQSPDGEWYKAAMARDTAAMARLRPEFDRLSKLAAQG